MPSVLSDYGKGMFAILLNSVQAIIQILPENAGSCLYRSQRQAVGIAMPVPPALRPTQPSWNWRPESTLKSEDSDLNSPLPGKSSTSGWRWTGCWSPGDPKACLFSVIVMFHRL
jgi:hypothetical protein